MKLKRKLKQSTNNSLTRIIRDSSPKDIVGTLVGFMMMGVFMLVGNNAYAADYAYSIIYDDNVVSNMPIDVNDGRAVGGEFSLSGNTPARSGYKFLGWCNTLPSTADNADSCSGSIYQPNAGLSIASATDFHFFAMWKKSSETWYFNETLNTPCSMYCFWQVNFSANGQEYRYITQSSEPDVDPQNGLRDYMIYGEFRASAGPYTYDFSNNTWYNEAYRTITITGGEDANNAQFRSWLASNATEL